MLDFFPGGTITVQGANTAGFLTISNGTFRIVGSDTFSNPVFASATYTIPLTGAFWLNAPNATVVGQAGNATNNGLLRVSDGTLNVGTLGTHVMGAGVGACVRVEGGTAEPRRPPEQRQRLHHLHAVGRLGERLHRRRLHDGALVRVHRGHGRRHEDVRRLDQPRHRPTRRRRRSTTTMTGTMVYTGGTLNVGTAATATNFTFRAQGQTPAIVVDNTTNNKTLLLSGQLNVWGVLTINSGHDGQRQPGHRRRPCSRSARRSSTTARSSPT